MRFFNRRYELLAGDLLVRDLDIRFKAVRTSKKEPNTCDVTLYNLREENRKVLEQLPTLTIQLKAGYLDSIGTIFLGGLREAHSSYEKPDWLTYISTGDGEKSARKDRINKSFAKGTSVKNVLKGIVEEMSIDAGNLDEAAEDSDLIGAGSAFVNGVTVSGQAWRELDRIARSAGFEWSIQNQSLQLLKAGQSLTDTAIVLNSNSGLIGSPTQGNDGTAKFRSLMNSEIIPGRQIEVSSLAVSGRFKAERCEYVGDTRGDDWYVDIEAKELT